MKKIIILFLFFSFISTGIKAQTYFPEGAKWYYHNGDWQSPAFSYKILECLGDSIFNGDTLTNISNDLFKQINKKIYKLNFCDSTYSLLYDFGANVNDTMVIYPDICYNSDSIVIKIDSINTININGNLLDHFYFSQLYSNTWNFGNNYRNIIEGIGNTTWFYPDLSFVDPQAGPLRCYEDTIVGYYNSGLYASCDTTYTVGINENEIKYGLTILPNPSINNIKINAQKEITKVELFDMKGSFILSTKQQLVNIADLKRGVYFVKVYFDDNVITRKIAKE
jgi:hypothetical protein